MKLNINNVRLAFPELFEAKTVNGEGVPAYSCSLLLPPDSPYIKEINAAIETVAKAKWADKAASILKVARASDKLCLHDGDLKANYAGYAGNFYVSCRSIARPTVIDRDKAPLTAADGRPYSGCYVNALIELWPMDNLYGKRINAQLRGVQFYKDGEAFSSSSAATAAEFEDLSDLSAEEAASDLI